MMSEEKQQPAQQEPVAYGMWDTMLGKSNRMMMVRLDREQDGCTVPLYTSPPARQEPAFHGFMDEERCCVNICYTPWAPGGPNNELPTAYYTSPPAQRTWVGLTDEEFESIEKATLNVHGIPKYFGTAIEAKLKEKNT